MRVNLLIVDEEPAARTGLKQLCERTPDMRVVGEADTGAKAIEAIQALRPDLTLLDEDLPDMSAFDVLRALRRREQRRTILLTASARDAPGVLAAGALAHLLKPVNETALSASFLRARARGVLGRRQTRAPALPTAGSHEAAGQPLFLVGEREHRLYPLDPLDIDYIKAAGNYVTYHLAGVEYIARESLKHLAYLLGPVGFVRIERSLLLNVRAIAYAQPGGHGAFAFTLSSGSRLHSGPAYRDTILSVLPLRRRTPSCQPGSG
jgi:two-component system, LytTR family, response regulator